MKNTTHSCISRALLGAGWFAAPEIGENVVQSFVVLTKSIGAGAGDKHYCANPHGIRTYFDHKSQQPLSHVEKD